MHELDGDRTEVLIGPRTDLDNGTRKVIKLGSKDIGVFAHDGRLYAFENRCVHQGGPVCEGTILGKVEAVLGEHKRMIGERFSSSEIHLVCPWHGYEYDLATGECATDRRLKLSSYEVIEREGNVYVLI